MMYLRKFDLSSLGASELFVLGSISNFLSTVSAESRFFRVSPFIVKAVFC